MYEDDQAEMEFGDDLRCLPHGAGIIMCGALAVFVIVAICLVAWFI